MPYAILDCGECRIWATGESASPNLTSRIHPGGKNSRPSKAKLATVREFFFGEQGATSFREWATETCTNSSASDTATSYRQGGRLGVVLPRTAFLAQGARKIQAVAVRPQQSPANRPAAEQPALGLHHPPAIHNCLVDRPAQNADRAGRLSGQRAVGESQRVSAGSKRSGRQHSGVFPGKRPRSSATPRPNAR